MPALDIGDLRVSQMPGLSVSNAVGIWSEPRSQAMKPNQNNHKPEPDYLRSLIEAAGLSQRETAKIIGISERAMRYYLSGTRKCPYPVQFAMENLK